MFNQSSILLLFSLLIVSGLLGGWLARRAGLSPIVGQILAGLLLGQDALRVFDAEVLLRLKPIATFALCLVAITIGGHLDFRRLHNAWRRIVLIAAFQSTVAFVLVLAAMEFFNPLGLAGDERLAAHLLLASLAAPTSAVSVVQSVRDQQARGLVVKTVLAVVAVDNLLGLLAFELCFSLSQAAIAEHLGIWSTIGPALGSLALSIGIGVLAGFLLDLFCRRQYPDGMARAPGRRERQIREGVLFAAMLVTIGFTTGVCEELTKSVNLLRPHPVLANMALGLYLANRSAFKDSLLGLFEVMQVAILSSFFVAAGAHLHWTVLGWAAGGAALLYTASRAAGKVAGAFAGGWAARTGARVTRATAMLLIPQGALTVALLVLVEETPEFHSVGQPVAAVVLAACVLSELFGAKLGDRALQRAGEAGRDRLRLIEFLQEEFIRLRLSARDRGDLMDKLCAFAADTHAGLFTGADLRAAVGQRESEGSTAIGLGIAVPHARLDNLDGVHGVLATLDPPLEADTPDGQPLRLAVLLVTPKDQSHLHLEVTAALVRMLRNDRLRRAILDARTTEEIAGILDSHEADTFNYFVET